MKQVVLTVLGSLVLGHAVLAGDASALPQSPPPEPLAQQADDGWEDDPWGEETRSSRLHGFLETGLGVRIQDDPALSRDWTLAEMRLRLESEWQPGKSLFSVKIDAGYDEVLSEAIAEVRELTLSLSPTKNSDLLIGRQVLTWGTGDFVFLNDLFAKNFESFFSGRDDEYLKDSEAAVRWLVYGKSLNWDFVWQPVFEPDQTLDGERFSFFVPTDGGIGAPDPPIRTLKPTRTLANGELAVRLSAERNGSEYAVYAHRGYFQQPTATDDDGRLTYAPLLALGGSLRRPALGGLLNLETVFYRSGDDTSGEDPFVVNSQVRTLVGYERELATNLTGGFQYVAEWTLEHDELIANSPFPEFEPDEIRHLLTSRLTYLLAQQKWRLSSFLFWSPSDRDAYLRAEARYRANDRWSVSAAANLFWGDQVHTFFGQLERNDNLRVLVRRSF